MKVVEELRMVKLIYLYHPKVPEHETLIIIIDIRNSRDRLANDLSNKSINLITLKIKSVFYFAIADCP